MRSTLKGKSNPSKLKRDPSGVKWKELRNSLAGLTAPDAGLFTEKQYGDCERDQQHKTDFFMHSHLSFPTGFYVVIIYYSRILILYVKNQDLFRNRKLNKEK